MLVPKLFVFALVLVAEYSALDLSDVETDASDLVAVVQVHRHGQRTPVSFCANDPYSDSSYWEIDSGQLTNTGKNQHFSLGKLTRYRYKDFLPSKYNNNDFHAQTTDVDRTHMSAQSNIAGIFRPHGSEVWNDEVNWQPIPVHAADSSIISTGPSCAIFWAEVANVLVNAEEYAIINKQYADLYAYLTEKSGNNVTSVSGVDSIWDTLLIEEQFGYKLPEWAESVYPEPLTTLSGYAFKSYAYTTLQKQLFAGNWLYWVSEYFSEMFSDTSSNPKFQLFSAHDTNIAAILSTIGGYYSSAPPSFASTIYFELRNKSGVATVNIWHKDQEVWEKVNVEGCDFDCTLDDFNSLLSTYLVNTTTWTKLCATTSSEITDLSNIHESAEVLQELENVLSHANNRRHPKNQLSIKLPYKN